MRYNIVARRDRSTGDVADDDWKTYVEDLADGIYDDVLEIESRDTLGGDYAAWLVRVLSVDVPVLRRYLNELAKDANQPAPEWSEVVDATPAGAPS